jgi:hypothetical protein
MNRPNMSAEMAEQMRGGQPQHVEHHHTVPDVEITEEDADPDNLHFQLDEEEVAGLGPLLGLGQED